MSEPTRVITPRLEEAIARAVGLLDIIVADMNRTPAGRMATVQDAHELRAELLEAFEEARKDP